MPRSRDRATLEAGLKLDLNRLVRRGFIKPGAYQQSGIRWTDSYYGDETAAGVITADMANPYDAWLRIQIGGLSQLITLTSSSTPFRWSPVVFQMSSHGTQGISAYGCHQVQNPLLAGSDGDDKSPINRNF